MMANMLAMNQVGGPQQFDDLGNEVLDEWEEGQQQALAERQAEALRKTREAALDRTWARFYKQAWFYCVLAFLSWMAVGLIWYTQWQEWRFWTAFYFQVQAGFSVGYGYPTEDRVCEKKPEEIFSDTVRYYVHGPGMMFPNQFQRGRGGCQASDISKAVTTFLVLAGTSIVAASIGVAAQVLSNPEGGWYKKLIKDEQLKKLKAIAEETEGWADDVVIYIKMTVRRSWFKALVALLVWVAVGVIWGMTSSQQMSFLTALYFAVSSISSAGLEHVHPVDESLNPVEFEGIPQGTWAFVGVYLLIGVPLYAVALSTLAAGYVDMINKVERDNTLHSQIDEDEYKLMDYLGGFNEGGGDGKIDMFEFVECQLLRLNLVSVSHLFEIKKRFIELDLDGGGTIDRDELMATSGEDATTQVQSPKILHALDALNEIHKEIEELKAKKAELSYEENKIISDKALAEAREKTERVKQNKKWSRFYTQAWFKCFVSFLLWLFTGIVFYTQWQGWDFWVALYYTLQAGMSVGFGNPDEDEICYLDNPTPGAAVYANSQYQGKDGCVAGDLSKLFTVILILSGSSIIASAIGIIAQSLLSPSGGWYKQLIRDERIAHLKQKAAESPGWADDVAIYIKILMRNGMFQSVMALLVWTAVGVVYCTQSTQRMTFLTALYFSITGMSTAGLEGLMYMTEEPNVQGSVLTTLDRFPGGNWAFVSLYIFVGIPIYAWALTSIAGACMAAINQREIYNTLHTQITEEEFQLMDYLGYFNDKEGGDGKVDMFEFVECQLLRMNMVSVSDLFDIKRRFVELDLDGGGTIDKEELMQTGSEHTGKSSDKLHHALEAMERQHESMEELLKQHRLQGTSPEVRRASYQGGSTIQSAPRKPAGPYDTRESSNSIYSPPALLYLTFPPTESPPHLTSGQFPMTSGQHAIFMPSHPPMMQVPHFIPPHVPPHLPPVPPF
mmetsp:Transcript_5334/g.13516  ORF Transcript_5334/g.13516 Transcript_5334/m.13516 type:complete len:953 (-) Transcript_5334:503-3361(-)